MKSIRKKLKHQSPHIKSTPLIDEAASPSYNAVSTNQFFPQEDSNRNNFEMEPNESKRSQSTSSSQTAGSPTLESEFRQSLRREQSWVTDARKQSTKEPVLDSEDTHFSVVSISTDETWFSGIWQSLVILVLFLITPSIIFALIGCCVLRCCIIPNTGRSARERKKVRYAFFLFLASTLFSLFKDCGILALILFSLLNLRGPFYAVIYPMIVLLILVLCVFGPLMVYELTGVSFTYGFEDKKESQKKPTKSKEKQVATEFMNRNLSSIHEVTNLKEQFFLLSRETPSVLLLGAVVFLFVLCGFRGFLYWMLHTSVPRGRDATNVSSIVNTKERNTTTNSSSSINLNDVIMVLSSINIFVLSFSLSLVFLSVYIWNHVCLKLWRSLLKDLCTTNSMISRGIDGVSAWWRVYQILLFFSSSPQNPFVFLRIILSVIFAVFSIVLSSALLSNKAKRILLFEISSMIIFDIVLLVSALVLAIFYSFSMAIVKRKISQELNIVKLRMTNLSVSLPNEHDRSEGEYQTYLKRFKARHVRSTLQLLQEVSYVINHSKTGSFPSISDFVYFAVVVFGLVSVGNWVSRT